MKLPFTIFKVADDSMEPTYRNGDYILVYQWYKDPKPQDIVIFRHPTDGMILVKRIYSVKNNKMYLLGDNSVASTDSRNFGDVDLMNLFGKVIHKF